MDKKHRYCNLTNISPQDLVSDLIEHFDLVDDLRKKNKALKAQLN